MKAYELITILENIPKKTELMFYLIKKDGSEEDGDKEDILLENLSVISTSQIDDEVPILDFGLQNSKEKHTVYCQICDDAYIETTESKNNDIIYTCSMCCDYEPERCKNTYDEKLIVT